MCNYHDFREEFECYGCWVYDICLDKFHNSYYGVYVPKIYTDGAYAPGKFNYRVMTGQYGSTMSTDRF